MASAAQLGGGMRQRKSAPSAAKINRGEESVCWLANGWRKPAASGGINQAGVAKAANGAGEKLFSDVAAYHGVSWQYRRKHQPAMKAKPGAKWRRNESARSVSGWRRSIWLA
jgi:hypothetical protein